MRTAGVGRGPAPKPHRQRPRDEKRRARPWRAAAGIGWQHGATPVPPPGLEPMSLDAWETWFGAWFAAHWTPADVPALRILVELHDAVERGELTRAGELRLWMDTYGITPKGQQDRRWTRPDASAAAATRAPTSVGNPECVCPPSGNGSRGGAMSRPAPFCDRPMTAGSPPGQRFVARPTMAVRPLPGVHLHSGKPLAPPAAPVGGHRTVATGGTRHSGVAAPHRGAGDRS
jgi:hypothetical protein